MNVLSSVRAVYVTAFSFLLINVQSIKNFKKTTRQNPDFLTISERTFWACQIILPSLSVFKSHTILERFLAQKFSVTSSNDTSRVISLLTFSSHFRKDFLQNNLPEYNLFLQIKCKKMKTFELGGPFSLEKCPFKSRGVFYLQMKTNCKMSW